MKRRDFLKYGSVGVTLPFWLQHCDFASTDYPIHLNSDHATGHLLLESEEWPTGKPETIEIAIVGGGLAGLTAAYQLRDSNFRLFELSTKLGGTVSSETYQNFQFSQGAHYDLAYPENYGREVLKLLEELKIIKYEPWKRAYGFTDHQHIIPYYRRQQCYDQGKRRRDVIPESNLKDEFVEVMLRFSNEMKMPTRLIDPKFHYLDKVTFYEFLSSQIAITNEFKRQVDYHMLDDYGGTSDMVSALAGVHYFACRPYYTENVDLFSPPNGNEYFADALMKRLDKNRLKASHLVNSIIKQGDNYELRIINLNEKRIELIRAERVIYAGQKHALKYVYPEQEDLFNNRYAPWMVVNLITKQVDGVYGYWQNEYLGENKNFLGFIDSSVQSQGKLVGKRVFTAYYCLNEDDREYLTTVGKARERIAKETQEYIEEMLNSRINVEAAFMKVMGHAMPIPQPGYLFADANDSESAEIIYAGVDNGRLPLLFEAMDSGILAADLV